MIRMSCTAAIASVVVASSALAQVASWNFNSATLTAPFPATTGSGTMSLIGGVTFTTNTGSPNDAGVPNNAPNTTSYPAQGVGSGTAGVEFVFSTAGFDNIRFVFDQRHSNTSSRFTQAQYSVDGGATFTIGPTFETPGGDTWNFDRTLDLTGVAGAGDNPALRVRIVSVFDPALGNAYSASRVTSTYAGSGTLRMDNVRVLGDAVVSTPPQGSGVFSPAAVCRGAETTLTVTASPGLNPPSGSLTVTADLSALGGSAAQSLTFLGGNSYGATILVGPGAATGFLTIPVTVSDDLGRSSTAPTGLAVGACDFSSSAPVVISMIYGAGGNSGAIFNADFVEIYNRSCAAITLDGWSLQYTSAGGNNAFDGTRQVNLSGVIRPGEYRLIQTQRVAEGAPGLPIPTPDFTAFPANQGETPVPPQTANGFGMALDAGRLALCNTTDPIGFGCVASNVVDLVGYGGSASCYEGVAPTATASNTTAVIRKNNGCQDSNNGFNDFDVVFPRDPFNGLTPATPCTDCPPPACRADFNGDGNLDPDDLADYIACYFTAPPCPLADYSGDGSTDPDDLSDYIADFFAGCN